MKRSSFLALSRPIVTCIMKVDDIKEAIVNIKNGEYDGVSAFAIHLERFDRKNLTEENFRTIASATPKPVMFLYYRTDEYVDGSAPLTDNGRARVSLTAIRGGQGGSPC